MCPRRKKEKKDEISQKCIPLPRYDHAVWYFHAGSDFPLLFSGDLFRQKIWYAVLDDTALLCGCGCLIQEYLPHGKDHL